ncbi:BZ3500_MvSof-1268-A1-R1_Chr1-1g01090 [Microbotryum saponariae]|uniref:BZ3500_MvSof-1268-A1-R1_Chr1-1g01090 protein n=1 Tax=Microbotryum saponariae TaxID=289078 RepID=A0A2X0K9C9_9BASI|nr:BZ3500_MvSof-1268-A1-R1_Chr1-1g01090 [Microbotryum saponariae]SCZ93375.1 BZ3501_MvSof-1269-A2-R1_Chr1-1g00687 [Microbotryum saponariae]
MVSTGRELGLYERFSLTRANVSVAPSVVLYASFKSEAESTSGSKAAALERAIGDLLNEFPLLRSRIEGRYTRTPRFVERDATNVSDILDVVRDNDSLARVEGSPSPDEVLTTRLGAGLHQANEMDVSVGPLWKVLHHDRKEEQSIVLVMHHTLSDGLGAKNLFAQIVQRVTRPDETQVQNPSLPISFEHIPQSQEQSVPGLKRMHWSFMAGMMWAEVIRPFLPFRLIASKRATVLPNPPFVPPYQQLTELRIIRLPNELMARIKARARANGVSTLHPVLLTALFASLLSHRNNRDDEKDLMMDEILLETPVSVRDVALGHPITTGNYVAAISTPPSFKAATLSTRFYSLTRSCASYLSSPVERTRAEQMMLTLSLVPDPASAAEAPVEQGTGWETWLRKKMENEVGTWSCTIDASNLGVFPVPKDVAEEIEVLGWAQPGSAMGAAIGSNIMSSPANGGELVVTLCYRRGTIKDALLDHICGNFPRVLERLGRADDSDEGITLADLTK